MNLLRAWVLVVALAAAPWTGHAAGLGKIYILSGLGQPLRVEIDLMVDKKEADEVSAKLASPFTYERSGLSWLSALSTSKVAVEKRANGDNFVRITTTQTVNEPFVELLLDLKWPSGSIQRQYTVLLDPPVQSADRERAAAAPQTGTAPAVQPGTPAEPAPVAPTPAAVPPSAPASQPEVKPVPSATEAQPVPMPAPEPAAVAEPAPATVQEPAPVAASPEPAPAAKTEKIESAAAPQPTPEPASAPSAEPQPAPSAPQSGAESAPAGSAEPAASSEFGPTKRGDNLTKAAKKVMPGGVTLEQVLVLLYRANPDAFEGKNMNRLRTGKVLRLPDPLSSDTPSPKDARREVALQAADWQAYRDNLAAAATKVTPSTEPSQSAGGKVTPKVEDKGAANAEKPKEVLKLSKGESPAEGKAGTPGPAGKGGTAGKAGEEDAVAGGKQLNEANTRITKLEESLKNAQKLLELKNQGMADAQKQAKPEAGKPEVKPDAAKATTPAAKAEPAAKAGTPEAKPTTATPPSTATAPATPPAAETKPAPPKPAAPKPPVVPVKQPGLMDQLMDNLVYVGGGAVALLLGGVLGYRMLRRKKDAKPEAEPAPAAALIDSPQEAAPPEPAEAKPFNPTETDGMGSASSAAMAEEVDPVAEAEIFLAYGRDAQAEELLKEAMQSNPKRLEIHSKLLQVYANRKDARAFEQVAKELHTATSGQGDMWMQAARLGYSIDPQNDLYAAGRTEGSETQVRTTQFPTTADPVTNLDFDVGVGSAGASTQTDIDLSGGDSLTESQVIDLGDERSTALEASSGMDISSAPGAAQTMDFRLDVPSTGPTSSQPSRSADTVLDLDINQPGAGDSAFKTAGNGGMDFDINSLTMTDHPEGRTEPAPAGSIPDLDLGDLNLDMGAPTTVTGGPMKDEHWQNVQTKFDLAKAYQEMGDKEGAREILREVVQEGDTEQRSAAQSLLTSLS